MAMGASEEAAEELLALAGAELLEAALLEAGICTGLSVFRQSLHLPAPTAAMMVLARPSALSRL